MGISGLSLVLCMAPPQVLMSSGIGAPPADVRGRVPRALGLRRNGHRQSYRPCLALYLLDGMA